MYTKTFFYLTVLCIWCFYSSSGYAQSKNINKPNIVIILADDLGYGDLGVYGGEAKTPNLDRLAKEGIRFTDFHSNGANCSPTRAALLTGRYQQRIGIEGALGEDALGLGAPEAKDEITIAEYLQEKDYRTGIFGKWHLGYNLRQSPIYFGFDEFRGMLHGAVDYHSHVNTFGRFDWWYNDKRVKEEGYVTNLITEHSLKFIESHQEDPFFLFVSHLAIHFPWQTPDDESHREVGKRYRAVSGDLNRLGPHTPDETGKVVQEMIEVMDYSVGKVIDKLKQLNIDNRTLVFFMSDNGGITEYRGGYTEISSNAPLRGAKHSVYEGGHRVPAIAWWPGMIEEGIVTDEIAMTMDILPTALELANIKRPKENGPNSLDGVSLLPLLLKEKSLSSRTLFWQTNDKSAAVRKEEWKLVVNSNEDENSSELYNLKMDINESNDLSEGYSDLVKELQNKLNTWRQTVNQEY
ncbi:sulfatase-like hydrolase/transferase [Halalkalibaculum sp. DA384]|uniref:sulfatase-like hydrolase/transferase n=1 Tax=Halalkalibaculum sp. DA384 TaxID=3373606 RepID=UPI0037540377